MKRIAPLVLFLFLIHSAVLGQGEAWDAYLTDQEGVKGAITLRMDLVKVAPLKSYPFVLITGIAYPSKRKDGFPENATFKLLYQVNDDLTELLNGITDHLFAGTYTRQYERLQYFYLKSDSGVKERLTQFYQENYPDYKFQITIKQDPQWEYYLDFLYPDEATRNYMSDESVVRNLEEAGDNLEIPRRVDHWLYFNTEQDLQAYQTVAKQLGYTVEKMEKTDQSYLLVIWRKDKVALDAIHPIATALRKLAEQHQGTYDGWETKVVK